MNLYFKGKVMNFKLSICGLIAIFFFFSHSYAQDWSRIPRASDTSNYWRKTPQISKYPGSKFRWQKDRRHKRLRSWNHKSKHWNKRTRIYNPIYWRYSGLGSQRLESESVQKQIIELVPAESYNNKEPLPLGKKEFTKPQIETVSEEAMATAESTDQSFQQESDGINIIGSEGSFRIDKHVQVKSLKAPVGSIQIYSSD